MNEKKAIIQSLFYPAVLGSMFVFIIQSIVNFGLFHFFSQLNGYWAIGLIIYFCISYLNIEYQKPYNIFHLTIDLIETIIIFLCFNELGILGNSDFCIPNYRNFYFIIASIPFFQSIWNILDGEKTDKVLLILAFFGCLIFITAGIFESKWKYIDFITMILIFINCIFYIRYIYK